MRVLVCGSRTFEDEDAINVVLSGLLKAYESIGLWLTVIEGGARGADALAAEWVDAWHGDVQHETYPADWDRYGKSAGYRRNQQMLDEGKPEVVWAFVDKPLAESRGTAMMVDIARKAGVPVYVVEKL